MRSSGEARQKWKNTYDAKLHRILASEGTLRKHGCTPFQFQLQILSFPKPVVRFGKKKQKQLFLGIWVLDPSGLLVEKDRNGSR